MSRTFCPRQGLNRPRHEQTMAKRTVESSLVLDAVEFAREGALCPGKNTEIVWWQDEQVIARVCVAAEEDCLYVPVVQTGYGATTRHETIELERAVTSFGVERVWFLCPHCLKTCRKLYLPPRETLFLCRTCHDLTYESRKRGGSSTDEALRARLERLKLQLERLETKEETRRTRDVNAG